MTFFTLGGACKLCITWQLGLLKRKNSIKAESFLFRLNFNVYADMDNRERARARDKKQSRRISLETQYEILKRSGWENEKMLVTSEVKMRGSVKESERTATQATEFLVRTHGISSVKHVNRKFHLVVVQNDDREMYKKVCCKCKVVFLCFAVLVTFAF